MKKETCKNLSFAVWVIIILFLFALFSFGCQESQKQPESKVWGKGDPDPNHIKYFGNGNLSRLCYVQTQTINKQAKLITEFVALNAKQHQILGKSDIDLYSRVRKLEDPNGPKENKTPDKPH